MKRMAYQPLDGRIRRRHQQLCLRKRYRGGRASYIWIVNFADLKTEPIPRTGSNDFAPMSIGDSCISFRPQRSGHAVSLRSIQQESR